MQVGIVGVIILVCSLFSIARGLMAMFRGRSEFADSEEFVHTPESRAAASRWYGVAELVFGLGMAGFAVLNAPLFMIGTFVFPVGLGVFLGAIVVSHIIHAVAVSRLVKKSSCSFRHKGVIDVEAKVY